MQALYFYIFAVIAVIGALASIRLRNPINAILALAVSFFSLGGIYLLLAAQFVAVIQVILYTGAIVVLFLFTVMLLNLETIPKLPLTVREVAAYGMAAIFFVGMVMALKNSWSLPVFSEVRLAFPSENQDIQMLGKLLFENYVLVFQMVALILLVAMIAVAIMARKTELTQ